jgi:hypothetical protein
MGENYLSLADFSALMDQRDEKNLALTKLNEQKLLEDNKFGINMPSLQLGLQGLSSIAGIWAANKGLKQAKEQFEFQKGVTNTNLNNSIKSYNTALDDRINARAAQQGNMSQAQVADYKRLNQLSR